LFQLLGSLKIAVALLLTIASVLGWGTFYETCFGTAAVQRFIYHSWWFQILLAFLGVNLAVAAMKRYPWERRHVPFVLAHLGIILILIGGILGGRLGIEGQLIISEGNTEQFLRLPQNVLVVHPLNPGDVFVFPTRFESKAWIHEPKETFPVALKEHKLELTVDRYFPNAKIEEEVTAQGSQENPAIHLVLSQEERQEGIWLFSRDSERFGARSGEVHVLFLEPRTKQELLQFLEPPQANQQDRGVVTIEFPDLKVRKEIPVPQDFSEPIPIEGTPYQMTWKGYFTDFAITEQGVVNRSDQPNNPAVALTLTGPEGTEPFLAFALHPDFSAIHGRQPLIHAHVSYSHATRSELPPNAICLVGGPSSEPVVILTGEKGEQKVEGFELNKPYRHPWLGLEFWVDAFIPRAKILQKFSNRDDEVRKEALHLVARDEHNHADAWLLGEVPTSLRLGQKELVLEYRRALWKLPVTVKLIDFRKTNYPGIQMVAGFESDVELTDPERGLTLKRTITMNNPLKYRGFSFFQSGFLEGPVETPPDGGTSLDRNFREAPPDGGTSLDRNFRETPPDGGTSLDRNFREATVLSVRKDPGTPLVYAGFLIVIGGVVSMFVFRRE